MNRIIKIIDKNNIEDECIIEQYLMKNNYPNEWVNKNLDYFYFFINFLSANDTYITMADQVAVKTFGETRLLPHINTHYSAYCNHTLSPNHVIKERYSKSSVSNFRAMCNVLEALNIIWVERKSKTQNDKIVRKKNKYKLDKKFYSNFIIEYENNVNYNTFNYYYNNIEKIKKLKKELSEKVFDNNIISNESQIYYEPNLLNSLSKIKIYDPTKVNNYKLYDSSNINIVSFCNIFQYLNKKDRKHVTIDKNDRIYHFLTNIRKEVRNIILAYNNYTEIDICNSHFQMILKTFDNSHFDINFIEDVKNNNIYNCEHKLINDYKGHYMYYLLRHDEKPGSTKECASVFNFLKAKYPKLHKFIKNVNDEKINLANELMKKESEIMNECISTCGLDDYVRIHDALFVKDDKVQEVKDFFKLKNINVK